MEEKLSTLLVQTNTSPPAPLGGADAILCPLCEYDLRGLPEPRCPECGYRFEWPDLLDPTRRLHPFLFEHHPERNLWSFRRTLVAGLRPARFWQSLLPLQPSSPRRLAAYAVVVLVLAFVAGPAAILIQLAAMLMRHGVAASWTEALGTAPSIGWLHPLLPGVGCYLLWPASTFLALLVLRISMRRARIRAIHVARCVVYSFDACLWLGLLMLAAVAAFWFIYLGFGIENFAPMGVAVEFAPAGLLAVVPYRLFAACRYYLRFDRPLLTVFASQAVALLVVLNALTVFER